MWSFFVDRGGTFTDLIAKTPTGEIQTAKILSENADLYEDAAVYGICKNFLKVDSPADIPPNTIDVVRVGTTVATNALLERRGAPTVFIATKGFKDALRIGHQARPNLFARNVKLHSMLYEEDIVVEVDERVGADGTIVSPLKDEIVTRQLREAFEQLKKRYPDSKIYSAAIVFVHGYKYPDHEKRVAEIARKETGFTEVCASHCVSPIVRFVPRGDTTVVDAYVTPAIASYASKLTRLLPPGTKLQFMQSSGGLADSSHFRGKDAVLSGPAGGVVGMVESALEAGIDRIVGFDMGGTSTDVSHYAGRYERSVENVVSGIRVRAPMMSIHTIAAGGGSILGFDGSRLMVGPHSAGASPGPACYRRGGPLTITDANVLLGRIQPDFFPATFGPNANEQIDVEVVKKRFQELCDHVGSAQYADPMTLAQAFLDLASIQMADAVKKISVQKGYDITRDGYVLQCFGGAGGQHACAVANALGLKKVMIHPCAGVLSAYGIGLARASCTKMKSLDLVLVRNGEEKSSSSSLEKIHQLWNELEQEALREIGATSLSSLSSSSLAASSKHPDIITHKSLLVRYVGGDVPIEIFCPSDLSDVALIWKDFEDAYSTRYSHLMPNDIVVTVASVEVIVNDSLLRGVSTRNIKSSSSSSYSSTSTMLLLTPIKTVSTFFGDGLLKHDTPLFDRAALDAGSSSKFVADECSIIVENLSTTVVDNGWTAHCDSAGILWLQKKESTNSNKNNKFSGTRGSTSKTPCASPNTATPTSSPTALSSGGVVDPLRLEVFGHLFMNITEQMGLQLQNTAWSVNIKERLDFSCAIFTSDGLLVANAPHMPVHLGSMGLSIKSVLAMMRKMQQDPNVPEREKNFYNEDVFVVNDPFAGGTHLPDITLISPVFVGSCGAADNDNDNDGDDGENNNNNNNFGRVPNFFVASRGHHADIGGATPGSLPPFSKHIDEEGVRIAGFRWRTLAMDGSVVRYDAELKKKFMEENPCAPARNFAQNLGDLLAQIAANETGAKQLVAAVAKYGLDEVTRYMNHLLDFGERSVRRALSQLAAESDDTSSSTSEGAVQLDNGAIVKVKITLLNPQKNNSNTSLSSCSSSSSSSSSSSAAARIDFTGSSGLLDNNFNAPRAVTYAAVLYSVRLLVADNSLPLNEGCLRPLEIIIPPASCLAAEFPAPVVAGNVEMSMCITNAILHAFGALADAQPTMNNFTFGTKTGLQYYETICGGSGAGPPRLGHRHQHQRDSHRNNNNHHHHHEKGEQQQQEEQEEEVEEEGFSGASAVQSHMTNSRLTDVEVLESRFPVRLEFFEIARGTGGDGRYRGGDGTRRCIRFLEPTTVCLLTNGRKFPARGLDGGSSGSLGKNLLLKHNNNNKKLSNGGDDGADSVDAAVVIELESLAQIEVEAGDRVLVQTPGGGGFLAK